MRSSGFLPQISVICQCVCVTLSQPSCLFSPLTHPSNSFESLIVSKSLFSVFKPHLYCFLAGLMYAATVRSPPPPARPLSKTSLRLERGPPALPGTEGPFVPAAQQPSQALEQGEDWETGGGLGVSQQAKWWGVSQTTPFSPVQARSNYKLVARCFGSFVSAL